MDNKKSDKEIIEEYIKHQKLKIEDLQNKLYNTEEERDYLVFLLGRNVMDYIKECISKEKVE